MACILRIPTSLTYSFCDPKIAYLFNLHILNSEITCLPKMSLTYTFSTLRLFTQLLTFLLSPHFPQLYSSQLLLFHVYSNHLKVVHMCVQHLILLVPPPLTISFPLEYLRFIFGLRALITTTCFSPYSLLLDMNQTAELASKFVSWFVWLRKWSY